jgi:glucose-1-phosphate thymidylyltransferase
MAVIGVLPAAGHATRLQPLDCSKEVLPVGGRPVADYVVERMRAAGCDELRIVTRPEKTDVVEYAGRIGARVILARPETVTQSFAAGIAGARSDDVILFGWPDSIWEPLDGYVRLLERLAAGADVALGLFRLARDLERSDVVEFGPEGEVVGIRIKPAVPPSDRIWGCAAARAAVLSGLAEQEWPGEHWDRLCREGRAVAAVELSDRWLDIGTHDALAFAPAWLLGDGAPPGSS